MSHFLQYETELPPGSGFALWGWQHLLWLLMIGLAVILILRAARHCGALGKRILMRSLAVCALFLQILPSIVIMAKGMYSIYTLPLHICSLASYAVFIHSLCAERSTILSEILFFPMLPGAVCALLFPDWTMYPAFSFFSAAGFLVHGAIAAYILLRLFDHTIRPDLRRIPVLLLFLAAYAAVMIPFDRAFAVNYGFLNSASPGSPLVWMAETFGTGPGYYISYAAAVLIVMAVWYGAWHLGTGRGKR